MFCGTAVRGGVRNCTRQVSHLALTGILTFLFTVLLHTVITEQVQALAGSLADLGGGASTLLGGILGGVAGYLINATVMPSWGWYLFIAAGVVLFAAGILGAVRGRKHGAGEMSG